MWEREHGHCLLVDMSSGAVTAEDRLAKKLLSDPAIPLPGTHSKGLKEGPPRDICTLTITTAIQRGGSSPNTRGQMDGYTKCVLCAQQDIT